MKKEIYFILSLYFLSCGKEELSFNEVVSEIVPKPTEIELVADGIDERKFTIIFNPESGLDKIKATAEVTNGIFSDNEKTDFTLVPFKNQRDQVVANFTVKSTTLNKTVELILNVNDFFIKENIRSIPSVPSSLKIVPETFFVNNSFSSEVKVEVELKNERNRKVSQGYKVKIFDELTDGTPINGRFRLANLTTNSDSKVSFVYSPGPISPNQNIVLRCEVFDEKDTSINLTEELIVAVLPKE